jgi:Sulfotransferase family
MTTDPIFILSAARSGSTLLRVMLAGHPRLFAPPELHLLGFDAMRDRKNGLGLCRSGACEKHHGRCDQRHGLQRALMELCQINDVASRRILDEMIERNDPIKNAFDLLIQMAAPRRLVDKTPKYAARLENLEQAERFFPNAHYVHLYRHPYAVIESLLRNAFEPTFEKAEMVWKNANTNILKFLAGIDPRRQISVAYESLVTDPESTLHGICSSIGIEFHPAVLRPYDGKRMTDGIRPGSFPPDDANFHSHNDIDKTLADKGRRLELPQPISEESQCIAGRLGYGIEAAALMPQ